MMIPPPTHLITVDQLDRYLQNSETPADREAVRAWLLAHPEARAFIERLTLAPADGDLDTAWVSVAERIFGALKTSAVDETLSFDAKETATPRRYKKRNANGPGQKQISETFSPRWWAAFAGAVAVVMVAVLFFRPILPQSEGVTRTYATGTGQQAVLTLNDGTRVTLAPRTTLRFVQFGANSRTVTLDGDAYFEVAQSSGTPFVVQSGAVSTQVLGTAFLVRHYAGTDRVRIAVADGKVRITPNAAAGAALTLSAGRVADISDSTIKVLTVDDFTPEAGFAGGKMVFNDTPLADVLATLSRWYGYQFRLADSTLTQRHVTVALSTQSSAAALENLEQFLNVYHRVAGDTVVLMPQPARPSNGTRRPRNPDAWTPTREVGR